MRLTDAVFARMVVDVRSLLDAMPSELKADIDGDFLTAIAEQPNEILKCAMYQICNHGRKTFDTRFILMAAEKKVE